MLTRSCLILGLILCSFHATFAAIPSFVVACDKNDVACQTRVGQAAVPTLTTGDPSLDIASLEPASIGSVDLSTGGLKFICTNTILKGLSTLMVDKFHINLDDSKLNLKLEIAKMDITAQYESGGQLLVLPIRGAGDAFVKIGKTPFDIFYAISIKEKNGKKYISLKDVNYKYDVIENVHYQFDNLFNGNKQLSDATHKLLNEQWKEVSAELSPPIAKQIVKVLTGNLKKLMSAIPLENWIKI